MYTRIANDNNKEVALGTEGKGINKFYCNQWQGTAALPGSDGVCGPDNGPQCGSCARFTKGLLRALGRADVNSSKETLEIQKELDLQKKMVRELQADKQAGEKRIRELETAAGAEAGDEWTRECNKVWPRVYQAVAKHFHPDKTVGKPDQKKFEAFFKLANAKNEVFLGKGRQSAAEREREEKEAVARRSARRKKRSRARSARSARRCRSSSAWTTSCWVFWRHGASRARRAG